MIVAAGWEWARLNGCGSALSLGVGVGLGAAMGCVWLFGGLNWSLRPLWLALGALWVILAVVMLRRGVQGWGRWPGALSLCFGLVVIACAWLALVKARQIGLDFLLSVLCLVWMADVAAYFGGKALGKHKLAPTISPGKSKEGAVSGLLGVFVLAACWLMVDPGGNSLYARLWTFGPVWAVLSLAFLVAMSVVGDLVESLVKRSAGAKDSSQLLPGHGGVLDRVDALLPVLPLAMMLINV